MPYRAMPYGATPCHTILAYTRSLHRKAKAFARICEYWIVYSNDPEFSQNLYFLCKSSAARSRVLNEAIWIFSHARMSTIPYFSAYIAVCCLYIYMFVELLLWQNRAHIFVNIESSVVYVNDPVFSRKGNIPPPPKSLAHSSHKNECHGDDNSYQRCKKRAAWAARCRYFSTSCANF